MKRVLFETTNRVFYDDGTYNIMTRIGNSESLNYLWRWHEGKVQFRGNDVGTWTSFADSQAALQGAYLNYIAKLVLEE